jgi:hypothetical protein
LVLDYVKQAIEEGQSKAKTAAKTDEKTDSAESKPAETAKQEVK